MSAPERSGAAVPCPSFAEVFVEYAPFVLRVMRHLGVPPSDLQDQSQEVFVAVFRGLEEFAGRSSLQTWLYGICLRVASNHRRRAHVRRERPAAELPEQASAPEQELLLEQRQGEPRVMRLLDTLDPDKREVFVLYELEEVSMKEVAELCNCPLQTAYSRLHAARRQLLARYQESEASP
jgi:RNA polymerase sigma-70 factor, ECF subfamily